MDVKVKFERKSQRENGYFGSLKIIWKQSTDKSWDTFFKSCTNAYCFVRKKKEHPILVGHMKKRKNEQREKLIEIAVTRKRFYVKVDT